MKTPEQKKQDKQRTNLKIIHTAVLSAWSFGQLKSWADVYHKVGYNDDYIQKYIPPRGELTFPALKAYLAEILVTLEKSFSGAGTEAATPRGIVTSDQVIDESKQAVITQQPTPSSTEPQPQRTADEQFRETEAVAPSESKLLTVKETERPKSHDASDNYGFQSSPNEDYFGYWFQKKAIVELRRKVVDEHRTGILLLSPTGTGKTYMMLGLLRRLWDINYHENKTFSHIPYLYIGRATILEQVTRVAERTFHLDPVENVEVINVEKLRSKAGQLWVKEEVKIIDGEEESFWRWKNGIQPCVILFDESQAAKNSTSTQHKIMVSYTNLPLKNTCLVSVSASPFTRVSEAKCFAVSTHRPLEHLGFPPGTILTEETWPAYARQIAYPAPPDEYNQAAIERLMNDLEDWVVRVKGVRPQFDADNGVDKIPFETPQKAAFYDDAWERFLKKKAKAETDIQMGLPAGNEILVALQQFSIAAEFCHAEGFAKQMNHDYQEGFAACCAVKWKGTIIEIVRILIEKYGWTRDMISLVWGGGQTQLTKKQKAKKKMKEMEKKFTDAGLDIEEMMKDLNLDEIEDRELLDLPEQYRLGAQSKEDRQKEIDRFQSGKSFGCIYTFRAGGVGLSLHHTDELTTHWDTSKPGFKEWMKMINALPESQRPKPGKVRRKESGYAVEEDIPFIPVRPRTNTVALTYNAIELVQGVGRCPRLTSLSVTRQRVKCYIGTVEVDMGTIVSQKLRCLTSVVKQKEDWQKIIIGGVNRTNAIKEVLATTDGIPDEDATMIDTESEEEDD